MQLIDWLIVGTLLTFIISLIFIANKYTRSVADYLAANRCAGRYLLSIAQGIAGLGAITIMAQWEMFYEAGFTSQWWSKMYILVSMILAITGWVRYRFRQTRAMTLAQFFEIRYSKSFRIFAGLLAFICGIINFGLFPSVGSRFIIYFAGLPHATVLPIINLSVSTYALVMFVLLFVSVLFTCMGGQIAIILTDFFQGIFCNIAFIAILIFIFITVDWNQINEALLNAPKGKSPVNPFEGEHLQNFNVWYFLIAAFASVYNLLGWQGGQGYACSAKTPHESKMAGILAVWKNFAVGLLMVLLPIVSYTIIHHSDFADLSANITDAISTIENENVRSQMTVPIALTMFLPVGLKGALLGVIISAFISTHDTMLHSWASIFIQDVVMPFRKKPFTAKAHLFLLRLAVILVAIFIFMFSLIYKQTQNIYMFFALTGTIFLGGAGSCIIGGLYWKRGTTWGAFGALITGSFLALTTFICRHYWEYWFNETFPFNSQYMYFFTMLTSIVVYVFLSLLQNEKFNLDRMLHRGKYAVEDDKKRIHEEDIAKKEQSWFRVFTRKMGLTEEFEKTDKILFYATILWSVSWFLIFIIVTFYHIYEGTTTEGWMKFWKYWSMFMFVLGAFTTVWFIIGGFMDLKDMFHRLKNIKIDDRDDGMVVNHHNLDEDLLDNTKKGNLAIEHNKENTDAAK